MDINNSPEGVTQRIRESAAYIRGRLLGGVDVNDAANAAAARDASPNAARLGSRALQTDDMANAAPALADVAGVAVVLGSGLGGFADRLVDATEIPYGDIPHFPVSTAPGHRGRLVFGALKPGGRRILCMQGRFHLYEGYSMREATWHIRVFKELGVSKLILTNASGGLEPEWRVGDLMLIRDHINYMFQNPLTGPNMAEYGPRFPDMTHVYSPEMADIVRKAAAEQQCGLREGVYVGFCGPSYETPAEIRMFRTLGASAVGMSTVPEAIVANHCGIKVCGISCITNYAAGILDQPLTEAEVIETAGRTATVFENLISRTVEVIN